MSYAAGRTAASEPDLIAAAREGDERAFRELIEPRRAELHAHCYRMLGSVHDADDALQEALLRAWRGLRRFERRSSLRSWLYRIATNACLDSLARRSKRVLPIDYGPISSIDDDLRDPLPETTWIEPYPDPGLEDGFAAPEARYEQRESVELAFIAALQHLPPRQRAVLVLREVLGFSAREVADMLETTTASVNSALQRARSAAEARLPEQSQQATLRSLGDAQIKHLVERFIAAWDHGDVDTMVSLLAEQPTFALPPHDAWYRGADAVDAFLPRIHGQWRLIPAMANGQLAFGAYRRDDDTGEYRAAILDVLTIRGGLIADVTAWATPAIFKRFGLPDQLPAAG
jgi:RNA polymerase sigma-70 factor (ECF subfamily)